MRRVALAMAFAGTLVATAAQAQQVCPPGNPRNDPQCESRILKFGPQEVPGQLVGPGITYFRAPLNSKFASLIKIRADFKPELAKSLNRL